jgi:hypothetical protein
MSEAFPSSFWPNQLAHPCIANQKMINQGVTQISARFAINNKNPVSSYETGVFAHDENSPSFFARKSLCEWN